jgi:Kv channel-interacting protein
LNQDGEITKNELELIIESVYDLMGKYTDPPIDEVSSKSHAEFIFNKLDIQKRGSINLDEFMKACYNVSLK